MTDLVAIWSMEHRAWWKADRWGYTTLLAEAGVYTREEAEKIVADANLVSCNEAIVPWSALTEQVVTR